MIERIFSPQLIDALGWTIIHSLWQGALFALLLGLALVLLRAYSAQARYLVSVGFLLAFFVAVGLTFTGSYVEPRSVQDRQVIEPRSVQVGSGQLEPLSVPGQAQERSKVLNRSGDSGRFEVITTYFSGHLPLIVTLWLMGVLVLQLRFLGQLVYIQRLKSYATGKLPAEWNDRLRELEKRLDISKPVRYLTSARVESAFTTGWLKPVVMLPAGILQELRESQLIAILAHELAHVKRHDFAVNLLQTLLSTFFFYHPGVWWMSARIHDEREHCCDDLAVMATGERIDYARTLVQLQEKELVAPKLAMAYGGVGFGGRVKRILSGYLGTATFGEGVVTTLIMGATLSLAMAATGNANNVIEAKPISDALQENMAPASAPNTDVPSKKKLEREIKNRVLQYLEEEGITESSYNGNLAKLENLVHNEVRDSQSIAFNLLMRAIYEGELEMVRYMIDQVDDLSRFDRQDFTPLMAAASENEPEVAQLLLDHGVDVNQSSTNGWTALIEAADEGSYEVARLLIENGAKVDLKGPNANRNALDMAASEGHPEIIQLLLDNGADIKKSHALHQAANEGQVDVVRMLLTAGFPVNARDDEGRTPLMHASEEDQDQVVRILLKAGADRDLLDNEGHSAIGSAAEEGSNASLREMTENLSEDAMKHLRSSHEILLGPAREGNLFTVQAMLKTGIDIDITDEDGNTALSLAAREGHVDVVRYLLGRGAQVQYSSAGQCSPVFLAARENHPEVVRLLVGKGAAMEDGCNYREVDIRNGTSSVKIYSGATPLIVAIEEGHTATVNLLLRLGSDVDQTIRKESYTLPKNLDYNRVNALNQAELTAMTTDHYATDGWTPLLEAVEGDRHDIVYLLLKAGADKNHRSSNGTTALSLAKKLGHSAITELLE